MWIDFGLTTLNARAAYLNIPIAVPSENESSTTTSLINGSLLTSSKVTVAAPSVSFTSYGASMKLITTATQDKTHLKGFPICARPGLNFSLNEL